MRHVVTGVQREFLKNKFIMSLTYFTNFKIGGSCSQQNIVRVPVDCRHSRLDRFLNVFRNPPVIFFFKVANLAKRKKYT